MFMVHAPSPLSPLYGGSQHMTEFMYESIPENIFLYPVGKQVRIHHDGVIAETSVGHVLPTPRGVYDEFEIIDRR